MKTKGGIDKMKNVIDWIQQATSIVVLTGAGMSTESGIPDFRSKEGRWQQVDPLTVATVEALKSNYALFQSFYRARIQALVDVTPHNGYYILAKWQQQKRVTHIATQNVDRLHQKAGATHVSELHGNIETTRCQSCGKQYDDATRFLNEARCTCGGALRPNVVLFGEYLPEEAWEKTIQAIRHADIVFVIGTSLSVYPVNQLPSMTTGKLIYINLEPASNDQQFDATFYGKAGEILAQLDELLL